jgi:ERCC4-type nuclease
LQSDLFGNVPHIVIDIHETTGKRVNSVKHLMSMLDKEGVKYVIQKIPIGDILGPDGIAIERKTVNDLVNTLKGSETGVPRLTRQLDGLLEYERPYILIENILSIRRDPSKGCIYVPFSTRRTKNRPYFVTMEHASFIHPSSLDALIDSIRERGIEVLEGFNALHSAGLLYNALSGGEALADKKVKRLPMIRTRKGLQSQNDEQEFFIAGFPQVNVVRARSLLEKFGNPDEVIRRVDDWGMVSGIGSKTVSAAKKLLHSKYIAPSNNSDDASPD